MNRCKTGMALLRPAAIVAFMLLAGCATHGMQKEGLALLEQGRYEEAVAKLGEAARKDPSNLQLRKDYFRAREMGAGRLVAIGNAERTAERFDRAEAAYMRALAVDPGNGPATTGLAAVAMDRRHAAGVAEAQNLFKKGDAEGAAARLKDVFLENPNQGNALRLQREINQRLARDLAAEPTLRANFQKPVTLQFRDANLKMVLESIAKTTGINILLDKDVRPDLKATIFVKNTSVEDTIDLILLQNQLDKKVLSENTIFIYPDVPAKTKDYQDLKVRSFHLVNADVKQMQAMIKTLLKTKDLFIHEKTNSLIMRDTPDAIRLAEKIIADQDIPEPEVMLELEVLEVTRTRASELGIQFPDTLTLTPNVTPPATLGSLNLGHLTKDNLIASPIPSVTLNARLNDSDVNVLASPRIRVRNREKAKIHIGDRLPVFTNSVTPLATGAAVTTGTVQYLDVGLKLEVEPDIHSDGEVGIKINLEVSTAGAPVTNTQSGTTAFQISTRNTATVLRLKDGETQVLAGLIQDKETRARIMVPGLGEIPVLGRLFSTHHNDNAKTDIVLSITPRISGKTALQEAKSVEFWSGTESNLRSTRFSLGQTGVVSVTGGARVQPPARTTPLPLRPTPQPAAPVAPQPTAPADMPAPAAAQGTPPAEAPAAAEAQPAPQPVQPPPAEAQPSPAPVQLLPPGQPVPFNPDR